MRRIAAMWRGYAWAGARMGRRTLYLWGAPIVQASPRQAWKDRLYHAAFNRRMLNAFLMSEERMAEYAAAIERARPEVIVGYVGPLVRLAEWLRAEARRPHRPQAILGAAEALHAPQRALLEEVFGAPAYDTYGCREFMLIASECEQRRGLHTTADHLHVEVANLQPCHAGGESGDVVVTDLHNAGMPLLRYANGDMATPSTRSCACGRGLPLLERIDGRRLDTLRTPSGHLLPGEYIVYAFLCVLSVKRYQVVQREADTLDVTLVPGEGFGEATLEQIRGQMASAVGDAMKLRFHVVDDIPASASGKFRVAICELPGGRRRHEHRPRRRTRARRSERAVIDLAPPRSRAAIACASSACSNAASSPTRRRRPACRCRLAGSATVSIPACCGGCAGSCAERRSCTPTMPARTTTPSPPRSASAAPARQHPPRHGRARRVEPSRALYRRTMPFTDAVATVCEAARSDPRAVRRCRPASSSPCRTASASSVSPRPMPAHAQRCGPNSLPPARACSARSAG